MTDQFVHGNLENKYNTKNPIYASLMKNFIKVFHQQLDTFVKKADTICEIGCGEGEILKILHKKYPSAELFACDISPEEIEKAKQNCDGIKIDFSVQNAENLSEYTENQFDLVICCEVLEHLPNPKHGLKELERVARDNLLVSVPNEPIWRILNILRGKYLDHFGNTPGHLNHWNIFSFTKFIAQSSKFFIGSNRYPFPWQFKMLRRINILDTKKEIIEKRFIN